MKVPRGDLSASADSVAHTRAFSSPDQRSTRRSGRASSSHLGGNFSHAIQDNCMLAGSPELRHGKSSMSVAVASGFVREPSITTQLHERNVPDRLLSSSRTSTRELSPTGAQLYQMPYQQRFNTLRQIQHQSHPATSSHELKLEKPSTPKLHMPINSLGMIKREETLLS